MAANQTRASNLQMYSRPFDSWAMVAARLMDAGSDHGSAAKGSAINLEVAGSIQLAAVFPFSPYSLPCVVLHVIFQLTVCTYCILYLYCIYYP